MTKPQLMQFIPAPQSTDALVVMSFPWVFFKMVTVMLKHVDFLSATITHFTQLDGEGDLCIREDLLFKNPVVQRF